MNLHALEPFLTGVVYASFSIVILRKLKSGSKRWAYSLWAIATVVWHLMGTGLYLKPSPALTDLLMKLGFSGIVFLPITMLHFCAAFLETRTLQKWIPLGYAVASIFLVSVWISGVFLNGYYDRYWGHCPKAGWMHAVFLVAVTIQISFFLYQLSRSLKDATLSPMRRAQTRAIRNALLWYTCGSSDFLINYGVEIYPLGFLFTLVGLGHIVYAVVQYQLLDIQIIIRRTLVYSIASAALASFYAGILLLTVRVLNPLFGENSALSVFFACGITALCHPLVRRIQRPIDRLLGRQRLDHGMELMRFSAELGQDQTLERARHLLSNIVEEAFHPKGFVIYRRSPYGYEQFARQGLPQAPDLLDADNEWAARFSEKSFADHAPAIVLSSSGGRPNDGVIRAAAPLVSQKRLQGFILLGEKRSDEPYREQELILLRILANQTAVALERPTLIKEVGSGFAHEIKTPLANIAMPAELSVLELQDLIKQGDKDPTELIAIVMKRLEYIVEQAFLASQRVDAMQQLSEAGTPHKEVIRLAPLATRVAATLQDQVLYRDAHIAIDVAPQLTLFGHASQLEILLTNLLKNGIDAVAEASQRRVALRAFQDNGYIHLEVEDTGPGIQAADQGRIYEPHFTTKSGGSRGMGLTIARRIAVSHGGQLIYERRENSTIMRLTLPCAS